jgi:N-acetylmuramoyl-L-alanine amidase
MLIRSRIASCFSCLSLILSSAITQGLAQIKPTPMNWQEVLVGDKSYVTLDSVKKFYQFTSLNRDGKNINLDQSKIKFQLKVGDQECSLNGVKFICSDPIVEKGNDVCISRLDLQKLIDPVLRPTYINGASQFRTVILDPGHGGKDSGAVNAYGTEKNYNLYVAQLVEKYLTAKGYRVIMTRKSDIFLSLDERVNVANAIKDPAIFISIHFNAGGRTARGIETFTLSPAGVAHYGRSSRDSDDVALQGNRNDSANVALATAVHGQLRVKLGSSTSDRGIKRARYSVLTGVNHPAILLEGGFMSHAYEARLIHNTKYLDAVARGITDAVFLYKNAVTPPSQRAIRRP